MSRVLRQRIAGSVQALQRQNHIVPYRAAVTGGGYPPVFKTKAGVVAQLFLLAGQNHGGHALLAGKGNHGLHEPGADANDYAWENSRIIHYCGRNKPWKDNYLGQLDQFYHTYAQMLGQP